MAPCIYLYCRRRNWRVIGNQCQKTENAFQKESGSQSYSQFMFYRLVEVVCNLLFAGFGVFAFLRPERLLKKNAPTEEVRLIKCCGAVFVVAWFLLLLVGVLRWL